MGISKSKIESEGNQKKKSHDIDTVVTMNENGTFSQMLAQKIERNRQDARYAILISLPLLQC